MVSTITKTILITGATRGLGLELAKAFSSHPNTTVIATARNPSAATELSKFPNVKIVRLEAGDLDSFAEFGEEVDRLAPEGIDELWNNAAQDQNISKPTHISPQGFAQELLINVVAQTAITQTLLPLLRKKNTRRIIYMSSLMGSLTAVSKIQQAVACGEDLPVGPDWGSCLVYSSSKAALSMSAIIWSGQLRQEGFTVTPIHPGWVQTDMGGERADITVDVSIAGMLETTRRLGPDDPVYLRNYNGAVLPW